MRGAGGMYDQRFGVSDVGQQRKDLGGVREFLGRLIASLDPKGDDAALPIWQVLLCECLVGAAFQPGIVDPGNFVPGFEPLRQRQGVLAVLLNPHRERLEPLYDLEGVERAHRAAKVAKAFEDQLEGKGGTAQGFVVF